MYNDETYFANGGFGAVFLGRKDDRKILIKYIHGIHAEAFEEEKEILQDLSFPSIIAYLGTRKRDGLLGIEMEFCERGALENVIFNPRIIYSLYTVTTWTESLFAALSYLHDKKLVHRDIKPANIFVTNEFQVKLGDLGSYRFTWEGRDLEGDGSMSGMTERFMSPATIIIISPINDVYSLGLSVWEMIERRKVLEEYVIRENSFSMQNLLFDIESRSLEYPKPPECPETLRKFVINCTKFDSTNRISSREAYETIHQINLDRSIESLRFMPIIDEDRNELLRPIESSSNQKIPVNSSSDELEMDDLSDLHADFGDEDEEMGMNEAEISREPSCSRHPVDDSPLPMSISTKLRLTIKHKIESFTDHRQRPKLKIERDKIIEDHFKRFRSYQCPSQPQKILVDPKEDIEAILKNLDHEFNLQLFLYLKVFQAIYLAQSVRFDHWSLPISLIQISSILADFKEDSFAREIDMITIFSIKTKETWFLVEFDDGNELLLIREDLNFTKIISKSILQACNVILREDNGPSVEDRLEITRLKDFDNWVRINDSPIIIQQLMDALMRSTTRLILFSTIRSKKFLGLEDFEETLETFRDIPGLKELPIPGYIFQLRNPPRHFCTCEQKHSIKTLLDEAFEGLFDEQDKIWVLHYPECASKPIKAYLNLYANFCRKLDLLNDPLKESFMERILLPSLDSNDCPNHFYFFHLEDPNSEKGFILLDHPMIYSINENVPCLDLEKNLVLIPSNQAQKFWSRRSFVIMNSDFDFEIKYAEGQEPKAL